jgi:tetratricopeptide (TPR) repeat protein
MGLDVSTYYSTESSSLLEQGLALFELGSSQGCLSTVRKSARKFKEASEQNPGGAKAWHLWALALHLSFLLSGNKEELLSAKEKIEHAIKLSASPDLHADAGIIYQEIGEVFGEMCDHISAIHHFEKASTGSRSKEFWNKFGKAYADVAEKLCDIRPLFKSIECFKKGVPSLEGWTLLGRSLRRLFLMTHASELFEQSDECLTLALDLNPSLELKLERAEALIEAARIKNDAKKLEKALEICTQMGSEDPQVLGLWAEALALSGEWNGCVEQIHEAQKKICQALELTEEQDPSTLIHCGKSLYSFAKYFVDFDLYFQAIESFQAALSLDRTLAEGWSWMGKTYATLSDMTEEADPLEKALLFYRKALVLKPDHALYFLIATLLIQQGDLEPSKKAIEYLNYLFENYPLVYRENSDWFFQYGLANDLLGFLTGEDGFYQKALNAMAHVLILNPKYPLVYHRIALTYSHLGQDRDEIDDLHRALHYFQLAAQDEKENEDLYIDWGIAWMHLADYATDAIMEKKCLQSAEKRLQVAAKLGSLEVYYPLACLYALKEDFNLALDYLYKSRKADTLPPLEEIQEDVRLETLQLCPSFQEFLALLQKK